ncbi:MAG: DNA cytosine methyltransferase [Candidatus Coprovivens sp.]
MYTIIETFVGAGGSHLGFKNNGFISKYVNDVEDNCLKTLLYNNPEIEKTAYVDNSDIMEIDENTILDKIKMKQGEADVMFGGIVCKGFSLAGERSPNDPRNYFYRKQLKLVDKIKPKVSVIENVPGILTANVLAYDVPETIKKEVDDLWKKLENYKGKKANLRKVNSISKETEDEGKNLRNAKDEMIKKLEDNNYLISVFEDIKKIYEKIGYKVYCKVLNSAWYGSSTKRDRTIIVAVRNDINIEFKYPEQIYGIGSKKFKTVNDALALIDYTKDDPDNVPMSHNDKTVERFKYIPEGDTIANHIDELPDELKISKFYSRGSTMRLAGNLPSPTLVPGHSNFPVHPKENRCITVREAACITGFPVDYKFFGNHSKRCEEVGNAVPIHLSTAVAKQVKELLDKYYKCN